MFKPDKKILLACGAVFLAAEILSFSGYLFPLFNSVIFFLTVIAALAITIYSLEYGVLIVLGELFVGSLGHLFYLPVGTFQVPIRIALWSVLILVFSVNLLRQLLTDKGRSSYWLSLKNFPGRKPYAWLFGFILIGLANGLLRGHGPAVIFSDFNAWLYFFLLWPLIVVYGEADNAKAARLKNVFLAAAVWLTVKTMFLLFVFTHDLSISNEIYFWLRKTLVGEMTPTKTGWPRIFIQGQIFSAIAFFFAFWLSQTDLALREIWRKKNISKLILAAGFLSSVLISFSRSFWVALIGTLFLSLVLIWKISSFKKMVAAGIWFLVSGVLSFALIYLVVAFPYIHLPAAGFSSNFLDRVTTSNEAAVASRWSLLPVLTREIAKEPFFGQGFGATVTYLSRDPRILQNNPTGEFTTYAFEWGYLDLWLKLGILGLAAYLILLITLIIRGLRRGSGDGPFYYALASGLVFLMLTHTFTPYLNHPLGIGFLLISSCFIWSNRVY